MNIENYGHHVLHFVVELLGFRKICDMLWFCGGFPHTTLILKMSPALNILWFAFSMCCQHGYFICCFIASHRALILEKGCILEHQIVRFGDMIPRDKCSTSYGLPSLFRARRSTLDTMPSALQSTFPCAGAVHQIVSSLALCSKWRECRRIATFLPCSWFKRRGHAQKLWTCMWVGNLLGAGVGATNCIFWIIFWHEKTDKNHQSTVAKSQCLQV